MELVQHFHSDNAVQVPMAAARPNNRKASLPSLKADYLEIKHSHLWGLWFISQFILI
jgi:hypothetical protein